MSLRNDVDVLPLALRPRPSVRKGSIISDLITIFRRNSTHPRLHHSGLYDYDHSKSETEHFLDHGPSDGNKSQDDDEDEERPVSRQVLLDKIREKKEVIGKLRCQPWNMNRKRRTLRLAQKYLAQNEPRVSKTHLYKGELIKTWRRFCRWLSNIKIYLIPWEAKIKTIESHFGSVVSSYFTFLRWVIFVNLVISLIIISLIVIPEVLADTAADEDRKNRTDSRKVIPPNERFHADELQVVWHYDGYIKYSPLFYGYYSNDEFVGSGIRYALPLAYFLVTLFVFGYSCFAILRKMASNAKLSKMAGSKDNQYTFNWKLFTGWDYTIGNPETAYNTVMAIIIKIRESIAECRTQVRDQFQLLLFLTRFLANAVILAMLAFSIYCISFAVQTSQTVEQTGGLINKNQMPTIVATITHVFPMIFDLIGTVERYHPRTALRAHLTRVLVLYVLNYMTLIVALFEKLDKIRGDEISKLIDERQLSIRSKRLQAQNGTGLSFSSKNFTDNEQAKRFRNGSFERFSLRYSRQSKILRDKLANGVQVKSEFGPVRLNNPDAILLNMSYADEERRFKAIKLGPSPLPTFTRTPFKPKKLPTNVFLEVGPRRHNVTLLDGSKLGPKIENIDYMRRPKVTTTASITAIINTTDVIITSLASFKTGKVSSQYDSSSFTDKPSADPDKILSLEKNQTAEVLSSNLPSSMISANETNNETILAVGEHARMATEEKETYFCWETMIGQELTKLVTMDLIITIASIFLIDFFRGLWIRYCSSWWCWDIETTFPEYGEFKVAENVLHIINNQGMIWLGLFFAPLLPVLNNIKLIIVLYIRGWACMSCNVPAREIFRASRSSNFYLMVLLLWLLLCTLPVGYVIASKRPSSICGPFAGHKRFYNVVTQMLEGRVDGKILGWLLYIGSPGVVIPVLLLLMLIIYFLVSLIRGLREANEDLQKQLIHERTEEKKKIFELAGGANKRKVEHRNNLEKNKMASCLPVVEQKRREPWRAYNGLEYDPSLSVSYETTPDARSIEENRIKVIPTKPIIREGKESLLPKPKRSTIKECSESLSNSSRDQSLTPTILGQAELLNKDGIQCEVRENTPDDLRIPSGNSLNREKPKISQEQTQEKKSDNSKKSVDEPLKIIKPPMPYNSSVIPDSSEETKTPQSSTKIPQILPNNSLKFDSKSMHTTFQPWPSIEEVKEKRSKLQNVAYNSNDLTDKPAEKRKSHKIMKPIVGSSTKQDASSMSQRRFRISVSPTRKFQTDPSGSDTDTSTGRRRFIIKQEVLPGSASSMNTDITGSNKKMVQAPPIDFDNDSPRVIHIFGRQEK